MVLRVVHIQAEGSSAPSNRQNGGMPKHHVGITFGDFAGQWLDRSIAAGLRCGSGYRSILSEYLIPAFGGLDLGAVTRQEYRSWLARLRQSVTRRNTRIAPRTVLNINRLLGTVFAAAVDDDLLEVSPIRPGRRDLPPQRDADPAWRSGSRFTRAEIASLIRDPRIPEMHRITIALAFFLGGRVSEVSALFWCRWDPEWSAPLGRLVVTHGYSTTDRVLRETKTGVAREEPVHPILEALLRDWYLDGWVRAHGRKPLPGDLIVAGSVRGGVVRPLRNDRAIRWLHASCDQLGIRRRGMHALRASFITLAQEGGANSEIIKHLSHPSPRDVFSGYSRFSWAARCEAVLKIDLPMPESYD